MTFDDIFELEAAMDGGAGGDGGAAAAAADGGSAGDGGTVGDGGQGGAAAAAGAAAAVATDAGDGAQTPAPFNFNDWAQTPEGQQQLSQTFSTWADQQTTARAEAEAAAARATENPFSDIEEGLGLLGIDPGRFKEYLGVANAPIMDVVEKVQQQEAIQWVDQQLTELGQAHPELLGDGVDKLSEIVDDAGQPLFNPDEVRSANREAVLYAAAAIQNASIDPRSGQPTVDHQAALKKGVELTAKRDSQVSKIAVAQFKRELEGVSGAARDISTGGSGSEGLGRIDGDETAVGRRFIAERITGR